MTMPQQPPPADNHPNPVITEPRMSGRGVLAIILIVVGVLVLLLAGIKHKFFKQRNLPQVATPSAAPATAPPAQPTAPATSTATPAPNTAQAAVSAAPTAPVSPLTAEEITCAAANPLPNTFSCPAGRTCIAAICRRGVVCSTTIAEDRFCAERIRAYETQAAVNNGAFYAYLDGTTALRPASTPERWDVRAAALVY